MSVEHLHDDLEDDPFLAASRRDSVAGAGVNVFVFEGMDPHKAQAIGDDLVRLLKQRKRTAEARVLSSSASPGIGPILEEALAATSEELVIITTATEFWSAEHLDPLLAAIELCDHVVGRRPAAFPAVLSRWLGWGVRSSIYAVPVHDVHSPCTIHRRESLQSIPLQSESAYADLELLAKATFLSRLLVEVPVPALPADVDSRRYALWKHDRKDLWRKPIFRRPVPASAALTPAEVPQGEQEGDTGPGQQDEQ